MIFEDGQSDDDVERKPLRRCMTAAWNKLEPASKAEAIGPAAAMVGGLIVFTPVRAAAAA
ncbi:hypothetical protein [Streptomyces flaveolus]|uniref:hypothetical protein n=1 Tax=Streptomyces flaveolus TaxID=67297 RepID=UPI003404A153